MNGYVSEARDNVLLENFSVPGEGARLDAEVDQLFPVVTVRFDCNAGWNSWIEPLAGFRPYLVAEGIGICLAVKALSMANSGPVTPVYDIFATPLADTSHERKPS